MDDRLSCTFFSKIGACRHGDKCSRRHIKPASSHTILLSNLYENPKLNKNNGEDELNPKQVQHNFDEFYRDIFVCFARCGEVKSLVVCENENNHLNGNVYVRYETEEMAADATNFLNQEWFNGRPVHCELSPVDSFQEANCRAYDTDSCTRDFCNFMHVRRPTVSVKQALLQSQEKSVLLEKLAKLEEENNNKESAKETESKEESIQVAAEATSHDTPVANVTSVVEHLFS